ncbi:MAG: helix-turn-helix domain-containing protein [Bacteroidota bacterium]
MATESFTITAIPEFRLQRIESFMERMEVLLNENNKAVFKSDEEEIQNQWIESTQVPKLLRISTKTWQNYRDKKVIPFSQFGRKIYVRKSDIEAFMQSNIIN